MELADLSAGTSNADFNRSGNSNSTDITDFLAAWFVAVGGGGC